MLQGSLCVLYNYIVCVLTVTLKLYVCCNILKLYVHCTIVCVLLLLCMVTVDVIVYNCSCAKEQPSTGEINNLSCSN